MQGSGFTLYSRHTLFPLRSLSLNNLQKKNLIIMLQCYLKENSMISVFLHYIMLWIHYLRKVILFNQNKTWSEFYISHSNVYVCFNVFGLISMQVTIIQILFVSVIYKTIKQFCISLIRKYTEIVKIKTNVKTFYLVIEDNIWRKKIIRLSIYFIIYMAR